jgi:hypothetical protein
LRFLLCAPQQKISGGKLLAVRTHYSYGHVPVRAVQEVSHRMFAERVADFLIVNVPSLPRYESPGANERLRCHGLLLQVQTLPFLPRPAIEGPY